MRRTALCVLALAALAAGCGSSDDSSDDRGAYGTARDACALATAEQLSEEFGGDAGRPATVAAAYARSEADGDDEADARRGCLDGLRTAD